MVKALSIFIFCGTTSALRGGECSGGECKINASPQTRMTHPSSQSENDSYSEQVSESLTFATEQEQLELQRLELQRKEPLEREQVEIQRKEQDPYF